MSEVEIMAGKIIGECPKCGKIYRAGMTAIASVDHTFWACRECFTPLRKIEQTKLGGARAN